MLSLGEQTGGGGGRLPLYPWLIHPTSRHLPAIARKSLLGNKGRAQFTWKGSVASAKESTLSHPCLLCPPPLPAKLLHLLTAFPAPFGSAWAQGHQRPHRRP